MTIARAIPNFASSCWAAELRPLWPGVQRQIDALRAGALARRDRMAS